MTKQPQKTNKKVSKKVTHTPQSVNKKSSPIIGPKRRFSRKLFTILSWGISVVAITFITLPAIIIFKELTILQHFVIISLDLRLCCVVCYSVLLIIMFLCAHFKACRWRSFGLVVLSFIVYAIIGHVVDYKLQAPPASAPGFFDTLYDGGLSGAPVYYAPAGNLIVAIPSHMVLNDKYEHTEENSVKIHKNRTRILRT